MKDTDIYAMAFDKWGFNHQTDMIIEECSELIHSLMKLKRNRCHKNDVINEIADVEIMIDQARMLFGDKAVSDAKRYKLDRLEKMVTEG